MDSAHNHPFKSAARIDRAKVPRWRPSSPTLRFHCEWWGRSFIIPRLDFVQPCALWGTIDVQQTETNDWRVLSRALWISDFYVPVVCGPEQACLAFGGVNFYDFRMLWLLPTTFIIECFPRFVTHSLTCQEHIDWLFDADWIKCDNTRVDHRKV